MQQVSTLQIAWTIDTSSRLHKPNRCCSQNHSISNHLYFLFSKHNYLFHSQLQVGCHNNLSGNRTDRINIAALECNLETPLWDSLRVMWRLLFRCIPHPSGEVLYVSFSRLHKEERLTRRKSIVASLETPYSLSKRCTATEKIRFSRVKAEQEWKERLETEVLCVFDSPREAESLSFTKAIGCTFFF